MKIDPNQVCYTNVFKPKNIGKDTGLKFVVFFCDGKSYVTRENGETILAFETAANKEFLDYGVKVEMLKTILYKDIDWDSI
jgi:hypothetical protein